MFYFTQSLKKAHVIGEESNKATIGFQRRLLSLKRENLYYNGLIIIHSKNKSLIKFLLNWLSFLGLLLIN